MNLPFYSNSLLGPQSNRPRMLGAMLYHHLCQEAYTGDFKVASKGEPVFSSN